MKHILFTILTIVSFYSLAIAQNPMPYSLKPEYRDIIKAKEQEPNFITPAFNNDSIYEVENKGRSNNSNAFVGMIGFKFDKPLKIKKVATKIKLDCGTVYLFKLTSPTSESLSIDITNISRENIENGVQVSWFEFNTLGGQEYFEVFNDKFSSDWSLNGSEHSKCIYLEVFKPKKHRGKLKLKAKTWFYGFASKKKTLVQPTKAKGKKSGTHGTAQYNKCNNDVRCPDFDIQKWKDVSATTAYIKIEFKHKTQNKKIFISGSCVFLNQGGGYKANDEPYILTAGHLFRDKYSPASIHNDDYIMSILLYVNYENDVCNSSRNISGTRLVGSLDVLKLGSSAMLDARDPAFVESQDYALLLMNTPVSTLSKYSIMYAGWESQARLNPCYGMASLGHPRGDVKRINIYKGDYIAKGPNNKFFATYFHIGVPEQGMSGGPVFNMNKELIGWNSRKDSVPNPVCNDTTQRATAGLFDVFYNDVQPFIDQVYNRSVLPSDYKEALPSHCANCTRDADKGETAIDCGGPCRPCNVAKKINITDRLAMGVGKTQANFTVSISPSSTMAIDQGIFDYTAGESVELTNNIEFKKGVEVVLNVNPQLAQPQYIVDRSERICTNITQGVGKTTDYIFYFAQTGVLKYRIEIFDYSNGNSIYKSPIRSIYSDGYVAATSMKNKAAGRYAYALEIWDVNGHRSVKNGFFLVL